MKNARGKTVIRKQCDVCACEFWPEAAEVNRGKGRTCSLSCAAALSPKRDLTRENNPNWKGGNPTPYRLSKRAYNERHPEKTTAHREVRRALRDGLIRRSLCEVCGSSSVEAHHDDYAYPLAVRWLCKRHHLDHHKRRRADGYEAYSLRQPE